MFLNGKNEMRLMSNPPFHSCQSNNVTSWFRPISDMAFFHMADTCVNTWRNMGYVIIRLCVATFPFCWSSNHIATPTFEGAGLSGKVDCMVQSQAMKHIT